VLSIIHVVLLVGLHGEAVYLVGCCLFHHDLLVNIHIYVSIL